MNKQQLITSLAMHYLNSLMPDRLQKRHIWTSGQLEYIGQMLTLDANAQQLKQKIKSTLSYFSTDEAIYNAEELGQLAELKKQVDN